MSLIDRDLRFTGLGSLLDKRIWQHTLLQTTLLADADAGGFYQFNDFTKEAFEMQYVGNGTTADLDITVVADEATTLATTLAGDETDGSADLSIDLTAAAFDTVEKVVAEINAQIGYEAVLSTSLNRFEFGGDHSAWLVAVASADVKTAVLEVVHDGGEGGSFTVGLPVNYEGILTSIVFRNTGAGVAIFKAFLVDAPGDTEVATSWQRALPATSVYNEELILPSPLRGPIPSPSALRFKVDPAAAGDDLEISVSIGLLPVNPADSNVGFAAPQDITVNGKFRTLTHTD